MFPFTMGSGWLQVGAIVVGFGIKAIGTYIASSAAQERSEEMQDLLEQERGLRTQEREIQVRAGRAKLERASRQRRASVANVMASRSLDTERQQQTFQRYGTELSSKIGGLEKSASIAGSIDDVTAAQRALQVEAPSTLETIAGAATSILGGTLTAIGSDRGTTQEIASGIGLWEAPASEKTTIP